MIRPLNNHCLIEVIDDYAGVIRNTDTENVQKGKLLNVGLMDNHLTASTGYQIQDIGIIAQDLAGIAGKTVYWQEYADTGSKFEFDGKKYVLVPFYRLIGFEE